METPKFKIADILYGIIIPLILVLLIYVLAIYVNPSGSQHVLGVSGTTGTIAVILSQGFAQMIVLGIPLVLGLLWNKWAGGAAGFIMGGMYYVATAGLYTGYYNNGAGSYNFYGDISILFWLVNGCHHRLHGWSIKQRINKTIPNGRCRLNLFDNCRSNTSLHELLLFHWHRQEVWRKVAG